MSIPQVEPTSVTYQHLEQNPTTFSSRLANRCFSVKGVTLLGTATVLIATAIYLAVHRSTAESDDDFPHDSTFSFYCKEACSLLHEFNPSLMHLCKESCDDTSTKPFADACILACNKLGMSVLARCIQSCK